MADIKSEPRPASNRNRWPASYWNAWPASSESAIRLRLLTNSLDAFGLRVNALLMLRGIAVMESLAMLWPRLRQIGCPAEKHRAIVARHKLLACNSGKHKVNGMAGRQCRDIALVPIKIQLLKLFNRLPQHC